MNGCLGYSTERPGRVPGAQGPEGGTWERRAAAQKPV